MNEKNTERFSTGNRAHNCWLDFILLLGAILISIGCFIKFDYPMWKGASIVVGCLILVVGLYYKAKDPTTELLARNLSGFGHFLIGAAAILTLPQIPEILDNIIQIKRDIKTIDRWKIKNALYQQV